MIRERAERLTGLFGAVAGFAMEFARLMEHSLRQRGALLWAVALGYLGMRMRREASA